MRRYFTSHRRASEPDPPEPRFQWRSRVNSLMKEDTNSSSSNRKSETSPMPISTARADRNTKEAIRAEKGVLNYSRNTRDGESSITSISRHGIEKNPLDYTTIEERKRERFVRTNSDSRMKMRVRFPKDEFLETSKSLDAADEDNDLPSSHWRARHFRRSRSKDKSGSDSLDRSDGNISDDHDGLDDDYVGACAGSFDSGLDLRGSSSPEDDDDDDNFMDENGHHGGAMKLYSGQENAENSALSKSEKTDGLLRHQPLPLSTGLSSCGGAIPKRAVLHDLNRDIQHSRESKIENFTEKQSSEEERNERRQFDTAHKAFHSRDDAEKDYFRNPSPPAQFQPKMTDQFCDDDHSGKESTPPHQRPGHGFFCDQIDGIEEIIERIITEEEEEAAGNDKSRRSQNQDHLIHNEKLKQEIIELRKTIDECNYGNAEGIDVDSKDIGRSGQLDSETRWIRDFMGRVMIPKQEHDSGDDGSSEGEDDSWACVPKILLEDVFTLLTPKDRHQASQVCRQWYDLFYSPRVWETFILLERTLTKKRFNLYKGYQRELCPWKTQLCLRRVGSFFKRIVITPITDYFNLCEFLRVLAAFLRYQEEHGENAMPMLHTFDFTFACATRGEDGLMVHGTGGQILDMIIKLLMQMSGLKHLKLNQLLTDVGEVPGMFSALTNCFSESLNSLEILNVTKIPYGLTDLSQFRNLIKLTLSPQHLNDEVIVLLSDLNLLHLHLIQDVYTCPCDPVSWEAWKLLKEMAPWMRVYLEITGNVRTNLLIQPRAPVYGVFLRTSFSQLTNDLITDLVEQYSKTLQYMVQERLPRIHGPRNFDNRCDSSLLFLVRRCPNLHTLVVNERISTMTLILLTHEGKNLNTVSIRQNALIKRCDWPSHGEWSREFYQRLKTCALDYELCTNEICTILKHRWRPLTDKQFMRLKIVPKVDIF